MHGIIITITAPVRKHVWMKCICQTLYLPASNSAPIGKCENIHASYECIIHAFVWCNPKSLYFLVQHIVVTLSWSQQHGDTRRWSNSHFKVRKKSPESGIASVHSPACDPHHRTRLLTWQQRFCIIFLLFFLLLLYYIENRSNQSKMNDWFMQQSPPTPPTQTVSQRTGHPAWFLFFWVFFFRIHWKINK